MLVLISLLFIDNVFLTHKLQPTTAGPSTSPTSSPSSGPTSSPSFTPGSVERFFCTEDESPLSDQYCDEDWADKWYNDLESCEDKCKGKKECVSKRCVTETPTLSPTLSGMPSVSTMPSEATTTNSPTSSPSVDVLAGVAAASTLIPTEDDLSDAAATVGGITWNDMEEGSIETTFGYASAAGEAEEEVSLTTTPTVLPPKFEFTGGDEEDSTESIPLSSFKLDLVVAKSNGNAGGRKQLRFLRGDVNKRQLQGEESPPLFQTDQDLDLVSLTSLNAEHLRRHFKKHLEGEPTSVELGILEKSEQFMGTGEVNGLEQNSQGVDTIMVSYEMIGYAVYERPDDSTTLPTTDELDAEVLKAFNDKKGQQAWLNAMSRSDDEVLHGIIDVEASRPLPLTGISGGSGLDLSKAVENNASDTVGGDNSDGTSGELTVPFVILIATAFAATFMVIGFLTYRKYQRYQRNNQNNDYVSYQNRKRKISIDAKSRNFTQKQYDHFESIEGSGVDQSEDPIYNDLEIVGGDTFPASQENSNSDVDPSSPCKQFNPKETVPYDEADTSAAYDMTYFAHSANLMNDQPLSDDQTLEGLYSDKDSYFQSTIAPSVTGHRRGDSIHSLDTLNNTFGTENPIHLDGIDGVLTKSGNNGSTSPMKAPHVVGYPAAPSNDQLDDSKFGDITMTESTDAISTLNAPFTADGTSTDELDTPVFVESLSTPNIESLSTHDIILGNVAGDRGEGTEDDVFEDTNEVKGNDDILNWRADDDVTTLKAGSSDVSGEVTLEMSGENMEQDGTEFTSPPDTSEITTTDELYARITELENKIMATESQLAEDDNSVFNASETLEVENSAASQPHSEQGKSEAAMTDSIREGIFTDETLGLIEQSRLSGTPPPSEGEVDTEMIKEAQENTLLGKYLDDQSESEEDSIFSNAKDLKN